MAILIYFHDTRRVQPSSIPSFDVASVSSTGLFEERLCVVRDDINDDTYRVTHGASDHPDIIEEQWKATDCVAYLHDMLKANMTILYDYERDREVWSAVQLTDAERSRMLDCAWLAHIAYPQLSFSGLHDLSDALALEPVQDTSFNDTRILYGLYQTLVKRLQDLPTMSLQTLAAATVSNVAMQTLCNQWIVDKLTTHLDEQKQWKVIDRLAFIPASKDTGTDERMKEPVDRPTVEALYKESVELLRTSLTASADFPILRRSGQERMIGAVAESLVEGGQLIVEAGTGTGKSLAYLLPAALYALYTKQRVIVSTHTIALQEQLRRKDLALLSASLASPVRTAVQKGRTHYLCMRKLSILANAANSLTQPERDAALAITVWVTDTVAGDREELALTSLEQGFWFQVQSESESCIHKRCPFFRDCFYFRARAQAAAADIVVTNHSLILSDLATDHNLLPPYENLIIDEAHHLEDQATRQLGAEVQDDTFKRIQERVAGTRGLAPELRRAFLREIGNEKLELQPYVAWIEQALRILAEVTKTTHDLLQSVASWAGVATDSGEKRIGKATLANRSYQPVESYGKLICEQERALAKSLSDLDTLRTGIELDDLLFGRVEDVLGLFRELRAALNVAADVLLVRYSPDRFVGWVAWRNVRSHLRLSLHLAPLSVAQVLHDQLFVQKASVICTSATLAVDGDFSYFAERTGFSDETLAGTQKRLLVPSPFHYEKQALLCVATDLPEAKDPQFEQAVGEAIRAIATDARGRTLVLFTSNQMLANVYRTERRALQSSGLKVLAQGMHEYRRTSLVDAFRKEEQAVLFGVNSFWEGIDLRGDDLRCLIIVKLPFAVPTHPVAQARAEVLTQAGKSPFHDYSVPQAVIRFTQGFGRLIRSEQDRGAVFVLDRRLVTTSYGKLFLRSLPKPTIATGTLASLRVRARTYF